MIYAVGMGCHSNKNLPTRMENQTLTPEQCRKEGGDLVGDIGNGAIHRQDYVCQRTGKPPLGVINYDGNGPIAADGAVCC